MVRTYSTMVELGTPIPAFSLPCVVTSQTISPETFADQKALLVMFICQHCPYVKHVQSELAHLGHDYAGKGLGIVAISSNDVVNYPDDAPENLKAQAVALGFTFPYCYDETQEVARAFSAACTPDFFLFDESRQLVYRGQLDESRPGNGKPLNGKDLRAAIDAALAGQPVPEEQTPSLGCNIKWKV
ncbi:MAG TPA: thioredoxin family protein [Acidobacteriota bacterium]|nr:thioredoxin family protein [Acidobacteriota bacterium]HMZ81775.1 thioredoxin family protein [Acidobacteriota bacterium]HNC46189.1 thioredoxin family protein [Acidobacteriota bacterium]HNJ39773.1 thioredoxin family protein [Acidobacteriota bacterium]